MQQGCCRHTRGAGHAAHRKRHWPGAGHTWFPTLGLFGAVSSSTERSAPNGLILFFFFFFLQLSTLQCCKMLLLLFSWLWLFCRSDAEQEQTHTCAFLTGLLCLGLKFVRVFGHHVHGTCSAAAQKSCVPLGGLRSIPAGHDAVRAGHALPPRAGLQLCLQLALCTYSSCIIQCCLYCIPLMFFILFSVG